MLGSRSAFLRSFTAATGAATTGSTTIRQQQRVVVCFCSSRALSSKSMLHFSPKFSEWATIDPSKLGVAAAADDDGNNNNNNNKQEEPYAVRNLVNGQWQIDDIDDSNSAAASSASSSNTTNKNKRILIPHPLDCDAPPIFSIPDTQLDQIQPFVESLRRVPKSGLHNPLKNPERYLHYGEISRKAGAALSDPDIADFFTRCIMATVPKSYAQASGEVKVTAAFLNNFAGDNVRRLAKSFGVAGDYAGQFCVGHRWPYGSVAIVTPFNFPLEIPVLQLMGALYMGNKPLLKPSEQVSIVMEQFLRLLHHCGMDMNDVDFLNCRGPVAQEVITQTPVRLTQFTGSSKVGEILAKATHGKVRLEDAGFDWKVIGPDVDNVDYVAWQCDQDAYATIGQKCSAQSIMFVHDNWKATDLMEKIKANASRRSLDDLTAGPTLTVTTQQFKDHMNRLASIPGADILFGGQELPNHKIPAKYGAMQPTAVYVPLEQMMRPEHFTACTSEIFAPFQVVTYYNDDTLDVVLQALEGMSHHLTAAVVSNDVAFLHKVLSNTVNGTTYAGHRARTTGAPQNHWFGPAGDPRGAGIGTSESIQLVWSCHREIIHDQLVPVDWQQPKAT